MHKVCTKYAQVVHKYAQVVHIYALKIQNSSDSGVFSIYSSYIPRWFF